MAPSTPTLTVRHLTKRYAALQAVTDLTFEVMPGEIFGLLGPNGAGKTTTIRMILDIIKPTAGEIVILGGPMCEATKARIGYLPEERGLYEDMTLLDTILFLAQLKGLSRKTARTRAEAYLRQVDLWEARTRRIGAMSRGMNQKAQFVAATLHEPELLIIDEPFSGLDPVNTRLIKDLLYRMQAQGTAIIMCSHQMHQVEAMCERILLIDRGRPMLYGSLHEVRRRFAANAVEVELRGELPALPGVERQVMLNGAQRLFLRMDTQPEDLLKTLVNLPGITVERFERVEPSLDEIFVQVVGRPLHAEDLNDDVVHTATEAA